MRPRMRAPTRCTPMANSMESAATTSVPGQVLSGAEAIRSKESKSKELKLMESREVIVVVGSALEGDIGGYDGIMQSPIASECAWSAVTSVTSAAGRIDLPAA